MASSKGGQQFIGKNRAPRVQVEYDVELYGAEKKVNLPFVMGVLSDLSGKPAAPLPRVDDRSFVDDRLKSMKPRGAFQVPNVISGEGNLSVDMTFESMADFSPERVAEKAAGLKEILEARTALANLLSYMDGKTGAEELLSRVLQDPALLKALSAQAKSKAEEAEKKPDEA